MTLTRTMRFQTIAGPVRLCVKYLFIGCEVLGDLEYTGTIEALLALGVLTRAMLDIRAACPRGRRLLDEYGRNFHLHRYPRRPGEMVLTRFSLDLASPGMHELFPGGLPTAPVTSQVTWPQRDFSPDSSHTVH